MSAKLSPSLSTREFVVLAASAVTILFLAWLLMSGLGRLLSTPTPDTTPVELTPAPPPPVVTDAAVPRIKATLYFASEDGRFLVPVEHEVPLGEGVVAQARSILVAQLAAAAPPPLVTTIPGGTALRGVFVSELNEAFVDLESSIRSAHPGGSFRELMTVYTIVNALLTNLPTLREVQILIDGQEVDTLAGHVDLRRALRKNEGLIQPAVPPTEPPSTQ